MQKFGNLSERKKLADEIAQLKSFPTNKEGFLIVVTDVNTKKGLEKAEVWRGLSSLINSENENSEDRNQAVSKQEFRWQKNNNYYSIIIALFISVAINIVLLLQLFVSDQSPHIENQNLRKENQEL